MKRTHNPGMCYQLRIVDAELRTSPASTGAVLIEGPKACGKTETARQAARSEVLLDVDERARLAAALDPSLVLEGAEPRLIDEWQPEPEIWNQIRRAVDDRRGSGNFILTGSSVPPDDETGLEADAVIEMPDGRWAAFEVKLGPGEVEVAAEGLLWLKARVDTAATGEPIALAVITATGFGYVRDDGVAVIPIGALAAKQARHEGTAGHPWPAKRSRCPRGSAARRLPGPGCRRFLHQSRIPVSVFDSWEMSR
jgi:hypothetical protein